MVTGEAAKQKDCGMKLAESVRASALAIFCSLAIFTPVHAEDANTPTPLEDARAILLAGNITETVETMFTQLVPVMESGFIGQIRQINGGDKLIQKIEADYPGGITAFGKRFGQLMMAGMRAKYPDMVDRAAEHYVKQIQPADLAAIRAFMESPTGKSMTAAQPEIQQQMSAAGQVIGRQVGEDAAGQLMAEAGKYFGTDK
jgi:hypothetical protein